jgi:hypothetical protein
VLCDRVLRRDGWFAVRPWTVPDVGSDASPAAKRSFGERQMKALTAGGSLGGGVAAIIRVNQRPIGTPDRHPKGPPLFCVLSD